MNHFVGRRGSGQGFHVRVEGVTVRSVATAFEVVGVWVSGADVQKIPSKAAHAIESLLKLDLTAWERSGGVELSVSSDTGGATWTGHATWARTGRDVPRLNTEGGSKPHRSMAISEAEERGARAGKIVGRSYPERPDPLLVSLAAFLFR